MKILVTGSDGFIGNYACSYLKARGHEIIFHKRSGKKKKNTLICDFTNDLPEVSQLVNIDTVLHLAGVAHDVEGEIKKELFFKINAEKALNLAELCAEAGVKKFIFISSVKASLLERDSRKEASIYALSKKRGEDLLRKFSKLTNMEINIIRPALVYGPGVKGNLKDLRDLINSRICPPLPETGNKKSLIHVDDLIKIIEKVIVYDEEIKLKEPIIACEDRSYSTREIYQSLRVASGIKKSRYYVPFFFFRFIKFFFPPLRSKIDKLFSNDNYNKNTPSEINFRPIMSLEDFNHSHISIKE